MTAAILVTGGRGKTGRRVAAGLRARGLAARVASRSADAAGEVRFDWSDGDTFAAALVDVAAVYLVAPIGAAAPLAAMEPFLLRAIDAGVRRFVLLSASSLALDGPLMGRVHGWLQRHAPEWAVLRPTWFMQNFSEAQHAPTIEREGAIYSATGRGRVGFIDVEDIAEVAVAALTAPTSFDRDMILTGPELLTYDDVAALITAASGRQVRHVALSERALAERLASAGMPADYAAMLAAMDTAIAGGAEARLSPWVQQVLGRPPRSFAEFAAVFAP
ncbi:MAG: ergot alkaloid biosynthesis protein [Myxococcales bacterium]|nr:ergot alkaloid biosynthesis protein [Myxococcales bacterium]